MDSQYKSLYYFTLVAKELNMSTVANNVYISQQALSKHIQHLEKTLGVQLFQRTPRLELTAEGHRVLLYAKTILSEEQSLMNSLQRDKESVLRFPVGILTDCCEALIEGVFHRFRAVHPDMRLAFAPVGYRDTNDLFLQNRIKAAMGLTAIATKYCLTKPMFSDDLYFVIKKQQFDSLPEKDKMLFLDTSSPGSTVNEILNTGVDLVMPWKSSYVGNTLLKKLDSCPVRPNIVAEAASTGETLMLCRSGVAGGFLLRSQVYCNLRLLAAEEMYIIPVNDLNEPFLWGIVYNEEIQQDSTFQAFVKCANTTAADINTASFIDLAHYREMQKEGAFKEILYAG